MWEGARRPAALLLAAMLLIAALGPAALGVDADACTELVANGGFETDDAWQLGPNPVNPQYVTYTKHSGSRSLALGITSGANTESFSSARQLVTIPASAAQAIITFWVYAMADSPATTDHMELALLDATGGFILNKPWYSHNDSRMWNQMSFDLTAWRGQSVQIYFNVYNDGLGGTAAMFVDDVSLQVCEGGPTAPPPTLTGTPLPPVPTSTPTATSTPGCADLIVNGSFSGGFTSWQQIGDPGGVSLVADPVHSTPYALQLGSLDVSLSGLASIRQLVTVPAAAPSTTLEAWLYATSQPGAGADYQEVALLNSSGGLLFTLWSGRSNNPAWTRLEFDLSPYAGQTVFVRFAVNNDGVGGRTALVVDDVRLNACTAGPATAIPTATPTATPPATAAPSTATSTPPPSGCVDLIANGGFEAGLTPWQPSANALRAQLVGAPVASGGYALALGSQTQNLNSYSSARQSVTLPWSYPRAVITFRAYTWAESLSGADRQQLVILGPGDSVWALPWSVLEDERAWRQHTVDISGFAGQTIAVYFNAINDGAGGRTALYVDDVHLWGCTHDAYPPLAAASGPAAAAEAADASDASPAAGQTALASALAQDDLAVATAPDKTAAIGVRAEELATDAQASTRAPRLSTWQIAAIVLLVAGLVTLLGLLLHNRRSRLDSDIR